jgi:GTP-binding protein HflX
MKRQPSLTRLPRERVLLCGVRGSDGLALPGVDLSEARGLVEAAGAVVVGPEILQRQTSPSPATLFGRGKVEEIAQEVRRTAPDLVMVDNELAPAQARNLEKAWNCRVIDRSELILDIFAKRARSQQARLQVELAQNEYLAPRLRRMWTHLERMEAAIGTRGPGETQLETDKRLLKRRIQDLRSELKVIEERKLREVRTRTNQFTVGLVGYTNAGKSSLLNRLTGADEFVADMLFATLDTRTRQWILPDGRQVLLSDTVGFLHRLPHHLVASFHATLEESLAADLLLHVVDASHRDAPLHLHTVESVLGSLAHDPRADVLVFNKVDRVPDPIVLSSLASQRGNTCVAVSAVTGEGLDELARIVSERLDRRCALVEVEHFAHDGQTAAAVRRHALVLAESPGATPEHRVLQARLTPYQLGALRREITAGARLRLLEAPLEEAAAAPSVDELLR